MSSARPAERFTAIFALAFGCLVAWRAPGKAAAFALAADVLVAWIALRGLPRLRRASAPVLEYLGIALPLGIFYVLYLQAAVVLAQPDVRWHDAALVRWDRLIVSPTDFPNARWLGEWFALAYLTYVPLLAGGTAVLYASGARDTRWAAERTVRTTCLCLGVCYLAFVSYPVLGPRFSDPDPQAQRMGYGPFAALARWNQDHAMLRGASFPSAHVAATLVVMWGLLRVRPRLFLCLMPIAISLAVGAVYLAYHYASDVVAGALVAIAAIALDALQWRDPRYFSSMGSRFALRRAGLADAAVIARQRAEMFRDMGELPDALYDPLVAGSEAAFTRMIPTEEYVGWLAFPVGRPAEIVGGAGVQVRALLPRPLPRGGTIRLGPEAIVLNVYTERAWRRNGIARTLLEQVIQWARDQGIARLVLHASADGRELYQQLGFEPTNEMMFMGTL